MIRKLNLLIRQNKNSKKLSECGYNTVITGTIDKKNPKSVIKIGNNCLVEGVIVTEIGRSKIIIGNNVYIGGETLIDCALSIRIEDDVLISYRCIIADSDNHSTRYSIRKNDLSNWRKGKHDWEQINSDQIIISQGAWIGANSIILKGVVIGEGAVIGAGSVVTSNILPYTIAAGNPARIIREIPENER
jgi:acetyltransferase-like isoleucine patch superfamily enzyme